MEDLRKAVMRKIKKLEYKNVHLLQDFEETEKNYKKLRDTIKILEKHCKSLMTYEDGGSLIKNIKSGIQIIGDTSKLKIYENKNMFQDCCIIGTSLSTLSEKCPVSSIGKKYHEAYDSIAKAKEVMNHRYEEQLEKLKELKESSKDIDKKRKEVHDLRYDLESLKQSNPEDESVFVAEFGVFKNKSQNTLDKMNAFLGNKGFLNILKEISAADQQFYAKSAEEMAKVK